MALSFAITDVAPTKQNEAVGQHRERTVKIVTSGTAAGTETITPAQVGFQKITFFSATPAETGSGSSNTVYVTSYNPTTNEIGFYKSASTSPLAKVSSGTLTVTFYARICGI
jgi:hypothetical protein